MYTCSCDIKNKLNNMKEKTLERMTKNDSRVDILNERTVHKEI